MFQAKKWILGAVAGLAMTAAISTAEARPVGVAARAAVRAPVVTARGAVRATPPYRPYYRPYVAPAYRPYGGVYYRY